ncbi:MAG: choice-of-anchor L domain-containing protein, partial [Bacteroidota bacterium]
MKYGITLVLCLFFQALAFAQPANDECSTAIDLGMAPFCDTTMVFTNVDATESNIGIFNVPTCFANGITPRDVWFSFTASDTIENYRITVNGINTDEQASILNPQVTLYRGSCIENGLAELLCASADAGETSVQLDVNQLTLGVTYYLRVNDYTSTGTPNAGAFNLCVEQRPPISLVNEGGSTLCTGTLYDTGGPDGNYGDGEDHVFTICPSQPSQCINIAFSYYNLETFSDIIIIYDGDGTDSDVIATLDGGDSNTFGENGGVCFEASASSGCMTIQFISDGNGVNFEGFEAFWECSNVPCVVPSAITVNPDVTQEEMADAIRAAETTLTVTDLNCPDGAFGIFEGDDTDLGLGRGIVLSSGFATNAIGPNTDDGGLNGQGFGAPGDPNLDTLTVQLTGQLDASADACILELDVFANTNELVFEYVFGSEEYPEFVNQFN